MSDTAPFSAQYLNENHVLSVSSLPAVGSWIMNESQRKRESRPDSSLSESRQFHSRPACSRLSSTELRKERISPWSDPVHFVRWKDLFVQTTRSRPTQHYSAAGTTCNYQKKKKRVELDLRGWAKPGHALPIWLCSSHHLLFFEARVLETWYTSVKFSISVCYWKLKHF